MWHIGHFGRQRAHWLWRDAPVGHVVAPRGMKSAGADVLGDMTPQMIASATTLRSIRLTVADLPAVASFYERTIGLVPLAESEGVTTLGSLDGTAIVELVGVPDAPDRPPRTAGLFHLAVLVPSRAELARAIRRVVD